MFHRYGDRKHMQRNRMKFLIKSLGWDEWRARFDKALEEFRAEGGAPLPFSAAVPVEEAPSWRYRLRRRPDGRRSGRDDRQGSGDRAGQRRG